MFSPIDLPKKKKENDDVIGSFKILESTIKRDLPKKNNQTRVLLLKKIDINSTIIERIISGTVLCAQITIYASVHKPLLDSFRVFKK